jgi:hypothetical protein
MNQFDVFREARAVRPRRIQAPAAMAPRLIRLRTASRSLALRLEVSGMGFSLV